MQINSPEVDFNIGYIDTSLRIKDIRFDIPKGLDKKEYQKLDKQIKDKATEILNQLRSTRGEENRIFLEINLEDYNQMRVKIKKIIQYLGTDKKELNIAKAKLFSIEQLIEFRGDFAKRCPNHSPDKDQSTPSLKYYRDTNTCYCFVCNQKFDAIDIYQKLNNVSLLEAVKALS